MVKLRTTRKAFQRRWMNCQSSEKNLIIRFESSMSKRNENGLTRRRYSAKTKNTGDNKLSSGMNRMQGSANSKSLKIHPPSGRLNRKPEPLRNVKRQRKLMTKSSKH